MLALLIMSPVKYFGAIMKRYLNIDQTQSYMVCLENNAFGEKFLECLWVEGGSTFYRNQNESNRNGLPVKLSLKKARQKKK